MRFRMDGGELYNIIQGVKSTGRDEVAITLKENRWFLKSMSTSEVVMFGAVVPDSEMEDYDKGDADAIGVEIEAFDYFLSSGSDTVLVELTETGGGVHKMQVSNDEGDTIEVGLVNIGYIDGYAQSVPNIDYCIELATDNTGFIKDFVSQTDNVVGSGSFMVSPRDGMLYLYAEKDDRSNWKRIHWEDFEDYNIDWSKGFQESQNHKNPVEDHAVDTMLSVDWFKDVNMLSDKGTVYIDNHCPIKIVFELDSDIKASYFISPRVNSDGETPKLPDRIVEDRGLSDG